MVWDKLMAHGLSVQSYFHLERMIDEGTEDNTTNGLQRLCHSEVFVLLQRRNKSTNQIKADNIRIPCNPEAVRSVFGGITCTSANPACIKKSASQP